MACERLLLLFCLRSASGVDLVAARSSKRLESSVPCERRSKFRPRGGAKQGHAGCWGNRWASSLIADQLKSAIEQRNRALKRLAYPISHTILASRERFIQSRQNIRTMHVLGEHDLRFLFMKSLVFFNNKGGVGKTTLLCNVAAYLALEKGLKVCVVDADPQCNSTQYFFNEEIIEEIYSNKSSFTIQSIVDPLVEGIGYQETVSTRRAHSFGVDVIPGDPRLAITEDLLAKDWGDAKAGEIRGIRTSLVFSQLLHLLSDYDLVLFDVGPSLGAINRAILLSADFFVSPMSVDIFSLRAFENIAEWIENWRTEWARGIENARDPSKIPEHRAEGAQFIGYVSQQYLAKSVQGSRRPVNAYEKIRSQIDDIIEDNIGEGDAPQRPFEIGTVQNLFSLVPMSQSNNKPVFKLQAKDGVVGAHFQKVKDSFDVFSSVSDRIYERING